MSRRSGGLLVEALEGLGARERRARMRAAAYLVVERFDEDDDPRIVVEAFACGLAVIAPRCAPLAELVEAGRNGLVFEPGTPRELARRLAWAEAFPERMRRMGECAQADYNARLAADWGWQRLYGERRRQARVAPAAQTTS